MGIIDYLQLWNCNKRVESYSKALCYCRDRSLMSAVDPGEYSQRFRRFMADEVFNSFDDLHDLSGTFDLVFQP